MKITLELDDPAWAATVLRQSNSETARTIVAQIEAQLPKPTPPEPKGDVLVRIIYRGYDVVLEPDINDGVAWKRPSIGVQGYDSWARVMKLQPDRVEVYRLVPSVEAIEALVQGFREEWSGCGGSLEGQLREFARRLLGGGR